MARQQRSTTTTIVGVAAPPALLIFVSLLISSPLCLANAIYPNTALSPANSSSSPAWTSLNGTFSLGFFSFRPNSYYVGIWYSSLPSNQSIIWTANRNQSVPLESSLHFTSDGRLLLTASHQTVWAASTLFSQDVVSQASKAQLLDTGNFILTDNASTVLWQSFDHPTDTLLPDQNFTYSNNSTLVPWTAADDPSPSQQYDGFVFKRTADNPGRIRLLSRNTGEYWSWPPVGVNDVLFSTTFAMDASGTVGLFNGDGSVLSNYSSCDGTLPTNSIKKLQLTADGNLKVLAWSKTTGSWNTLWRAHYFQCGVFDTCGEMAFVI
ncbi:hypothetical protein L7F22_026108 [Adiantum nelumboides]|nr:hypothetical protein [Adiantum nelumboides]